MFNNKIKEILHSLIPDLSVMLVSEKSLRHDIDDLVAAAVPVKNLAVVDDVNTNLVFGNRIFTAMSGRSNCQHITLEDSINADDDKVDYIRRKTVKCDALIAVGSGTINDLCKYAAHLDNKPYILFPTAASMNGYLSANASITTHGHKTTMPATLPKAVFCDLGVIASAPIRLSKGGLGDSLARPTAQADCLLSHLFLDTNYDERIFALLSDTEEELLDRSDGIAKKDSDTIVILMKLLLLSGIGMTIAGGSYPASQGEHLIAHSYNMMRKTSPITAKTLHGEEIAITSFYMAKRQESLLHSLPELYSDKFEETLLAGLFTDSLVVEFKNEFTKKQRLVLKHREKINKKNWDSIREKIEKIIIKPDRIEHILKQSQLPIIPEDIGWNNDEFTTACNIARFTRDRFTFLDME